jgi:hypothetical protein
MLHAADNTVVIPGLVPETQPSAGAGASGTVDAGHKAWGDT